MSNQGDCSSLLIVQLLDLTYQSQREDPSWRIRSPTAQSCCFNATMSFIYLPSPVLALSGCLELLTLGC